jgi:hypothetical protein
MIAAFFMRVNCLLKKEGLWYVCAWEEDIHEQRAKTSVARVLPSDEEQGLHRLAKATSERLAVVKRVIAVLRVQAG